jgi:hypothetical protein
MSSTAFSAKLKTPHEHWPIPIFQEVLHRHFHTCVEMTGGKSLNRGTLLKRTQHQKRSPVNLPSQAVLLAMIPPVYEKKWRDR